MKNRQEATIEEWGRLYEQADRLGKMRPWESFQIDELISIKFPKSSQPVYCSVLGNPGTVNGVCFYEGQSGFDDFMAICQNDLTFYPTEYAAFTQNCLTVYWGNREDLTSPQRAIIRELGFKYRGSKQWLYFLSYRNGYFPYNPDKKEVKSLTRYLTRLIKALEFYQANQVKVDFEEGEIYDFWHNLKTEAWQGNAVPMPQRSRPGFLSTEDPTGFDEVRGLKRTNTVLEIDLVHYGSPVKDNSFDRPINPLMMFIGDHKTMEIVHFNTSVPGIDPGEDIFDRVMSYCYLNGRPKRLLIRNLVLNRYLKYLCQFCDIELVYDLELSAIDRFLIKFQGTAYFKLLVKRMHKRVGLDSL